jgi:16S rRNA (guanine527-N7)-methyltransferase
MAQQVAHREQYDWAVARAVADMRVLAEYLLPLCRVGGHMLAMKGPSAAEESARANDAIHLLGGRVEGIYPRQLPESEEPHVLVVVVKEGPTPPGYPRRPGMAAKRPLT